MTMALSAGPWELLRRTIKETIADNGLGLAAQLAYYFTLSLFPALLFVLALASFFSLGDLTHAVVERYGGLLPPSAVALIVDQLGRIAHGDQTGLLTFGFVGAFWTTSTALAAIIDAMNRAYGVTEGRPWWRTQLLAAGLTIMLAVFVLSASVLVISGGSALEWMGLARVTPFWAWMQWPLAVLLVVAGLMGVYKLAPDVEQHWMWCWPGAVLAAVLWLIASLVFRIYVASFTDYTASYGAVGGFIILLLWFYFLGLAIVIGAELNSEIENASLRADTKMSGEKAPGSPDPNTPEGKAAAATASVQRGWGILRRFGFSFERKQDRQGRL